MDSSSPGRTVALVTRRPFTNVPFVEPRSVTTTSPSSSATWA